MGFSIFLKLILRINPIKNPSILEGLHAVLKLFSENIILFYLSIQCG